MKTWKPWTKFQKPRNEDGYHADIALESGEKLRLIFPNSEEKIIECPLNTELKLHIEICAEQFENKKGEEKK